MRAERLDRRQFLAGLAQLAFTACAGSSLGDAGAQRAPAGASPGASAKPALGLRTKTIELRAPYAVPYGVREIVDTTFVLRPDFRMPYTQGHPFGLTPRGAIWVPPRHPGLLIRGCQIVGWSDRWLPSWSTDHAKWIGYDGTSRPLQECTGIAADQVDGLTVQDVQIERMPGAGIYLAAVRDTSLLRVQTRRCFSAVLLEYFSPASEQRLRELPRRLSADVLIDSCIAMDNWGVGYPKRSEDYRDIYDPTQCIGSMGFYLYSADRLTVRRCVSIGSNKGGIKLGHCRDASIEDFYGNSLQLMGSLYWSAERGPYQTESMAVGSPDDPLLSENVRIVDAVLNKGASLTPPDRVYWPMSCVYPFRNPVQIRGGHIWAQNPPDIGYIQAWEGVAIDVRGVTFHGPKPVAARTPGSGGMFSIGDYETPKSRPSSINADLLTVNTWRASD